MKLTESSLYLGKLYQRIKRFSQDPYLEKYDQEALENGFTNRVDLFCTLCRGTRIFVGCGAYKDSVKSVDTLTSVYYKCFECNNIYSGIDAGK